jgi:hypothetical protein
MPPVATPAEHPLEVRYGMTRRFHAVVYDEVTATEVLILSVVHPRGRPRPWRRRLNTP